eukprot:7771619-Heterocapsa_arctica.AAC.1
MAYFHEHRMVPTCTYPDDLCDMPGGQNLVTFLTSDPNAVYQYAMTAPAETWAHVRIAEVMVSSSDPIDYFSM